MNALVEMSDAGVRLRFHRNEAPLAPPAHVVRAVQSLDPEALRTYPIEAQRALFEELGERLGVNPDCIAIGNGADEILAAVSRASLERGDNAITVSPTFGMYGRSIALPGASVRTIAYERRWKIDPDRIVGAADERTKLLLLGNPNNPTGDSLEHEMLAYLASSLPNALVVVDEVYLALSERSLLNAARTFPNICIVGSLSKTAGLAGMRIGYAVASVNIAARIRAEITPFPLSAAAIAAARAYLGDVSQTRAYEIALAAQVRRSLDAIVGLFRPHAKNVWRGATNFVLIELGPDAALIAERLAAQGVAVRRLPDEALAECIRVSAGNDRDTSELLDAARSVLREVRA